MKMKYCPQCGSIQLQANGIEMQCKKCSYTGIMKEDSIDVINSFIAAKRVQGNQNNSDSTSVFQPKNISRRIQKTEPKIEFQTEKNTVETRSSFNSSALMHQEKKPSSLKERLKKFNNEHIEIL